MGLEVFTQESFSTSTIETMTTEFRVVCTDSITDFKSLDFFPHCSDFTHRLMTGDQGKLELISKSNI
jgi:hypothetical protein